MITFLLGGARSGKSTLAVQLGERHADGGGDVVFVATTEPFDDEVDDDADPSLTTTGPAENTDE